MSTNHSSLSTKLRTRYMAWKNRRHITSLAKQIKEHAHPNPDLQPVIFFNASSRLTGLSQNAAFTLLTAWSMRLEEIPVINFVCHAGMKQCMLGTNRQDYTTPPPCKSCIAQSQRLHHGSEVQWFKYQEYPELITAIEQCDLETLSKFTYPITLPGNTAPIDIPLGNLVIPSIRWALRRHHLPDNENTRYLLRSYISSAYSIAKQFTILLEQTKPQAVVIFNGSAYPEATIRWITLEMGIRAITHEVGFQPLSVFFTDGQATAYPMLIPDDFELSTEANQRLDAYLENRFQGKFTMAGIRFWPEMQPLSDTFLQKAAQFDQIVPIFTNVVYDTSQVHANVVFSNMFAWLDSLLEIIKTHPQTLFVIRAHPDEMRLGTAKLANESVQDWIEHNAVSDLSNVVFIDPTQYISSYELIHRSKFVVVYNSSIGLEATLLGKAVVCGGRARYTQYPIVYYFDAKEGFLEKVTEFIAAEEIILPTEFQANARRFLYFQLYRTSLPMDNYLEPISRGGFVQLKSFPWENLKPENSTTMQVIYDGITQGQPFLYPEGS